MDWRTKDTWTLASPMVNLREINYESFFLPTKGQLIFECIFDGLNFPKKKKQKFDKFLLKNLRSGQIIR